MFPANVYAAVNGLMINGEPATALLPRTLMQLVYAAATVVVLTPYMRAFRRRRLAETRTALPAGALAGLQE
jgi:membrane protein implicated in regulation of membrane protease activity